MKNNIIYIFLLFSIHGYSQGFKDRFFANFGITYGADVNFSSLKPFTYTDPYNSNNVYKGYSKNFDVSLLTYFYGMRFNLLEKGDDFSMGIFVPITVSTCLGNTKYLMEGDIIPAGGTKYEKKTLSGSFSTFGRVSVPIFLQFNFGGGSTYNTAKEKGFTAGIGLDMSINPLFMNRSKDQPFENMDFGLMNFMPAVNIGRRKFSKEQFIEYNLKFGYSFGKKEFQTASEKLKTPGMLIMLTVGKAINY